jgi:cell division protein FtsL
MRVAAGTQVREDQDINIRGGIKDLLNILFLALLLGSMVFMTVWRRVSFLELGYEIRALERRESELIHLNKEMEIEKAMLTSPERVEHEARNSLGLTDPEPGQIRIMR